MEFREASDPTHAKAVEPPNELTDTAAPNQIQETAGQAIAAQEDSGGVFEPVDDASGEESSDEAPEESPALQTGGSGRGKPPAAEFFTGGDEEDSGQGDENSNEPETNETGGELTEQHPTAKRFDELFEVVHDFNDQPERIVSARNELVQFIREERVKRELIEAGLTEEEAILSVAGVEGADHEAARERERMSLNILRLQCEEALTELGLTFWRGEEESAFPIIADGERFAAALAEISTDDLTDATKTGLDEIVFFSAHNVTDCTLRQQWETLLVRYGDVLGEHEIDIIPHWERATTLTVGEVYVTNEILTHADAYGAEMQRLGVSERTVSLLQAMKVAANDGMTLEAAVLHKMGLLYADDEEFGEGWVAGWDPGDPQEWQPLNEVIDHLTLPGQPLEFRRHLARMIPATLDNLRASCLEPTVRSSEPLEKGLDEEEYALDVPNEALGLDEAKAALWAQKRDEYRRRLAV